MLGVSWRDRDTAMPVRRLKLCTSASEVCAWVTLTTCALERERMALVIVLPEVARNPTTNRPACGPMSTGCERTGFHSGVAAPADPKAKARTPAIAGLGSAILICLMAKEPSN